MDHLGVYGYSRDTTPNIDLFAASATRFTHAIAEGSFTFASISSLLTGLPPDRTGLLKARRLSGELTLLAETARDAGYRTRGYSENPYITPAFGFDRGFDTFDEMIRIPLLIRTPGGRGGVAEHPMQLAQLGEQLGQVLAGSRPAERLGERDEVDTGETVSWAMQFEHRACVRTQDRKLIMDTESHDVVGYYDLAEDPGEKTSRPLDHEGERLLARLRKRIGEGRAAVPPHSESAIDPKVLEQIRALGYAEE